MIIAHPHNCCVMCCFSLALVENWVQVWREVSTVNANDKWTSCNIFLEGLAISYRLIPLYEIFFPCFLLTLACFWNCIESRVDIRILLLLHDTIFLNIIQHHLRLLRTHTFGTTIDNLLSRQKSPIPLIALIYPILDWSQDWENKWSIKSLFIANRNFTRTPITIVIPEPTNLPEIFLTRNTSNNIIKTVELFLCDVGERINNLFVFFVYLGILEYNRVIVFEKTILFEHLLLFFVLLQVFIQILDVILGELVWRRT